MKGEPNMNYEELRDFVHHAQSLITSGAVEDRLRHYLSSKLPKIFPDSPWWIQAHMDGTEALVHFSSGHKTREGFVDAVVGKTAIEYEKNLTQRVIFDEGYYQVKEYCAALFNIGIPENEILGVLSDTVRWYGYSITVIGNADADGLYGPDNIRLNQEYTVDLSMETDEEFYRFEAFVNQFLNRDHSRLLNASTLVTDFGMDSSFYEQYIDVFKNTIEKAMAEKPDYAELIQQVWQNFVAYLGASDYGQFSVETYTNEFYLVTIAKIICVDVMASEAIISEPYEIKTILNGEYFTGKNINNLVDYDYFGWLNNSPYVEYIIDSVAELQRRLVAYDFSHVGESDIFGRLLAQLANREHRLMLGQEFTPHWIAHDIVWYNLSKLGDANPHILDMCCGSGVFLIESIKAIRRKYDIVPERYSIKKDNIAFNCVMGFDIDPLAVMLAKVNWIMSMRDLFTVHSGSITVPIYHADSLFVATPITHKMPDASDEAYILHFEHHEISLPAFLLSSSNRKMFDSLMAKIHSLAMAKAAKDESKIDLDIVNELIDAAETDSEISLSVNERRALLPSVQNLIEELEHLQREGRNGIWYFVICNSYRPGLIERQFNCVVSNPPWMAMSKLADNPYKNTLQKIAQHYSIKPTGASHPHMELATIFLLSAVDRYLDDGAQWSCVMPGSLLSGLNHEPLRKEKYRTSEATLQLQFEEIWELPQNTFRNKAIVLSGKKSDDPTSDLLRGRVYTDEGDYKEVHYTLNHQGNRSAWTNRGHDVDVTDIIGDNSLKFSQGCDLFPRTALFHEFIKRPNGNWNIEPIVRTSDLWYLVNDQKKVSCNGLVAENVDDKYIFDALISKHLSPFYLASPAKVLMPGKKVNGKWKEISDTDLALMNAGTAYVFNQIANDSNTPADLQTYLRKTINIYGKLEKQNFSTKNWLVLSSASGANPCAAYVSLNTLDRNRLIIDQTLYWYLAESENEAVYITGVLNSNALSDAIKDFQPEGGFGKRHIHTLPYKIIPKFDDGDIAHKDVVMKTRELIQEWSTLCKEDEYKNLLQPNSGSLSSRRRRQQSAIRGLDVYSAYESACEAILG
jgi:hypothetical protein